MKKLIVIALAVMMIVSAFALAACAPQEKVAYGIVHKSYVGKATVTVSGNKMTGATLDEAQLPSTVTADAAIEGFTVTATVTDHGQQVEKHFYKTVKFGGVEAIYDATAGYQVSGKAILDWLKESEANCEKWFEAVAANNVEVVLASGADKTIMTAAKLLKSQNGYWGTPAENALGWKANAEATCKYVLENGFGGISAKEDLKRVDPAGEGKLDNEWLDKNGVKTGSTWTDLYDYFVILKAAFEK